MTFKYCHLCKRIAGTHNLNIILQEALTLNITIKYGGTVYRLNDKNADKKQL